MREFARRPNPHQEGTDDWKQFEIAERKRRTKVQCDAIDAHTKKLDEYIKAKEEAHDRLRRSVFGRLMRFLCPWNPVWQLPSSEEPLPEGAQERQDGANVGADDIYMPLVQTHQQDGRSDR